MATTTVNDLLLIKQEGAPIDNFKAGQAVKAWLLSCKRRPGQTKEKKGKSGNGVDDGQKMIMDDRNEEEDVQGGDGDGDEEIDEKDLEVNEKDLEVGEEDDFVVIE